MSMMGRLREVTPALLARIRREPRLVNAMVASEYELRAAESNYEAMLARYSPQDRELMETAPTRRGTAFTSSSRAPRNPRRAISARRSSEAPRSGPTSATDRRVGST